MKIGGMLAMAWRAITGHKLRSTLTTLGVVIGVAAVITFVTLGASLSAVIVDGVGTEQATTMNVWAGPTDSTGTSPQIGGNPLFTEHDVRQLREIPGVDTVTPYGTVPTSAVTYRGEQQSKGSIVATTPSYFAHADFRAGEPFEQGRREVVLNPEAAAMFEENVSVGETLTVTLVGGNETTVTVVGILNSSRGQSAVLTGLGTSPRIYAPTDPFYRTKVRSPKTGEQQRVYSLVIVTVENPGEVERTKQRVRAYLKERSDARLLAPEDYGFVVRTNEELLRRLENLIGTLTDFVTGVALLSLLVGAIGIANIMLVSVTERTREIGIMKAVGATRLEVVTLFVVEASIIGVIGAALGTGVGVALSWIVTSEAFLDLPLHFPLRWFPIAIAVGVLVGVLSGLYPAWRGARVDPIEALRYE